MTTPSSINATFEDLQDDVERLRQENADLRASALLWKRLYEQALPADARAELESFDHGSVEKSRGMPGAIGEPPDLSTLRSLSATAYRFARR